MNPSSFFYLSLFPLCFCLCVLFERLLLPVLKRLAQQPIYADGPRWHLKKSGTPTMGGLAFVLAISITSLLTVFFLYRHEKTKELLSLTLSLFFALANAFIGFFDDRTKLLRKENAGLTPWQKLVLQAAVGILFLYMRVRLLGSAPVFSFASTDVRAGFLYYPICLFLILGIVNCANLTDGVDGLASSVAFAIGTSLFYLSRTVSVASASLSLCLMAGALGFLCFNLHPAKIFMGDTGSLFFGALVTSILFSLENPLLLLLFGGVYVIEGISVVLQVVCYKLTKRRICLMAPLHHHFEKRGWSENRIAIAAMLLTLCFGMVGGLVWRL